MEQQISSDLIRGHIDTIILYTLLDGDKFAEQISDAIEKKSENSYKINQATLYSALKRLENSKFVSSYQKDAEIGGRRKFFTLTEMGKSCIDNNLASWTHSRAIIDKLIDTAPQPIYKTQFVEKIVEVPVDNAKNADNFNNNAVENDNKFLAFDLSAEKSVNSIANETMSNIVDEKYVSETLNNQTQPNVSDNVEINCSNNQECVENVHDINFRNILNGLIQSSNIKKEQVSQKNKPENLVELKPIHPQKAQPEAQDSIDDVEKVIVEKFNQKISRNDFNISKIVNTIDYSDLINKANEEGYKLKVSSKQLVSTTGNLLINKLNLFVSLIMSLIMFIELFTVSYAYKTVLNIQDYVKFSLVVLFVIGPIFNLIKYKKNTLFTTNKKISGDSILTTSIIVFNLLLITFAAVLLFNIDFSIKKQVALFVVVPAILYFDILFYSIIKFFLAKLNYFSIKYSK